VKVLGIDATLVRRLIAGVSAGAEHEQSEITDLFARAAWSTIAEPGDGDAGRLISDLGAPGAMAAVIDGELPKRLADAEDVSASELGHDRFSAALERWRPRVKSTAVVRALERAAELDSLLVTPAHPCWNDGIHALAFHEPIALWHRGRRDALQALERSIALVGARASTGYGEHVAMEASSGLVDRGFAIVSGAAYGIDGTAHRAALASGGITFAFLAGGVDRFYPSGHDALLQRIVEHGGVFSELPCGTAPTKWRFLQRNRIIAAISQATVVLEAGSRSGSLNTAGHAAALGRPLGAVPGPVTSPASAGCHRLLREFGAQCVTDASQMAELAAGGDEPSRTSADGSGGGSPARSSEQVRVLDALSARSPRTIVDICARAGMSPADVSAALGILAFEDVVREREGGWTKSRAQHRRQPLR
jgi:DNA processing protein